jgi:hypothetical protein
MAVQAIVLHCLAGKKPAPGARAATRELEVADYEAIFKNRTIYTGQRESKSDAGSAPLYKRILGEAWETLPAPLAALHDFTGQEQKVSGLARVETGRNVLARLIVASFGFPNAGENVPVEVTFRRTKDGELWQRDFAGRKFSSFQSEGHGYAERLLVEKFGPAAFWMALVPKEGRLHYVSRHWSVFGIPLPLAFAPQSSTHEFAEDGDFCFRVEVKHWLTGLIVRYEGRLGPMH